MTSKYNQRLIWLGLAAVFGSGTAQAQESRRYALPAQPMTAAVLRLGVQGRVSIDAAAASGCGRSSAVDGTYDVETALRRMLAGSGCGFRRIDAHTYAITPRAPSPPQPRSRRPAPPVEPSEISAQLDDVIVTATKQEIGLRRAPYAISALDGEALEDGGRLDTAGLSTRLAGLTVTNLGPGRNKVFVRGVADSPLTGQTQAMVGLYLDETRLTYDAPDPDLRLVDLERVELLRGPQGVLYGAGALGGVLKFVSRRPDMDRYGGSIRTGFTATEGAGPGYTFDLVLNAPILKDQLALRTVLYQETVDGIVDDTRSGLTNIGRTRREGTRTSLLWRINPNWDLHVGGVFQTLDISDTQYSFDDLPPYKRELSVQEPSKNDFNGVSATLTGRLRGARLQLSSAYQGHNLDRRYDATPIASQIPGATGPLAYDEVDDITAFAMEARLVSQSNGPINWLAGLYVSHYGHDRTSQLQDLDTERFLYGSDKRDETNETAVFGEVSWSPNDKLKLSLGGRAFRTEIDTKARSARGDVTADAFEGELVDPGISAQAVVEYVYSDQILAYAQVSQGYRVGGFNGDWSFGTTTGSGTGPTAAASPPREYAADLLLSYEAGARWRSADDRLSVRAAAFVIDWRSIQSDRISADGLPFTANIGAGGNVGLEAEGAWRSGDWSANFNLMANFPHLDESDESYAVTFNEDLPGVPKFQGSAGIRRDGAIYGRRAWTGASVGYVGRSTQQLSPTTVSVMGDYVVSELTAAIELERWSANIRLDNLFGTSGDTFGYGNPFLVDRRAVKTPQRPRNLSISLERRF